MHVCRSRSVVSDFSAYRERRYPTPSPLQVPQVPSFSSDSIVRREGQKPADILSGFNAIERGWGENFDVSSHAAVIKMMMMRFGQNPADMFETLEPNGDGYDITMKDGFKLHLSRQELQHTSNASRFSGNDPEAIKAANFMMAAYAKRKQLINSEAMPHQRFDAVLSDTLRGATTYNVLKGMGMIGFLRLVPPDKMQEPGAVAVAHTYNFSGALVLDGVKHEYSHKVPVVRDYGYMLAKDVPAPPPFDLISEQANLSNKPVGDKPVNIWSGFYQGAEGNCVTVSAIKAAMMKYGQNPRGIYKNITETRDGYTVTMRDASMVYLTHGELKQAAEASNFRGADEGMLKDAIFLYAVSAKRAQMENHEFRAGASYQAALGTLNDKESPGDALRRLGLYAFVRGSTVEALANGATGTLANFRHSVVVVGGSFDSYGSRVPLASSSWSRNDGRALILL